MILIDLKHAPTIGVYERLWQIKDGLGEGIVQVFL